MGCGASANVAPAEEPHGTPEPAPAKIQPAPREPTTPAPPDTTPKVVKEEIWDPCEVCCGAGKIPEIGKCEFCGGKGKTKREVVKLLVDQSPDLLRCETRAPTYPCPECPAVFSREAKLKEHAELVHGEDAAEAYYPRYWTYCKECAPGDRSRAPSFMVPAVQPLELFRETSKDSVEPEPRPPCKYGDGCYRSSIKHRKQFSHPGDEDYVPFGKPRPARDVHCPHCDEVFKSKKLMRAHVRAKHTEPTDGPSGCLCSNAGVCPVCQVQPMDRTPSSVASGADFDQMFIVESQMLPGFRDLVRETHVERCTRDRPCPNTPPCGEVADGGCPCVCLRLAGPEQSPGLPIGYEVVKAVRVEDSDMWSRYSAARTEIAKRLQEAEVDATGLVQPPALSAEVVQTNPGLFRPLDQSVNEVYLFHSTDFRSALKIAQNDIRLDLAGTKTGAGLGPGFYLAESITKADEYARDEPDGYYSGIHAVLVFRVCLGKPFVTAEFDDPDEGRCAFDNVESGEHDSVIGDRDSAAGTFREFVVYNRDQAYPEYVLLYQRVYKDPTFAFRPHASSLPLQVPIYWSNCHRDPFKDVFREEHPVRPRTKNLLQQLLDKCSPDCENKPVLISVARIEDSVMWAGYGKKRAELGVARGIRKGLRCVPPHHLDGVSGEGSVLTTKALQQSDVEAAISLENMEVRLNELLLFHGTGQAAAYAITRTGFRINKDAGGTRFGVGAYFAEDAGKSLDYAPKSDDGRRYVLLCRVVCGEFYYTEEDTLPQATDLATAAGKDATLANPGRNGPREFIVFDESQVYPEYILELKAAGED